MTISGKAFSTTRNEARAQNPAGHPPVVIPGTLKANDGTYPCGLILKYDADGITLIPFVEGDTPVGVLDEDIDTATQGSGNYVRHGSVVNDMLKVGAVAKAAPTAAALIKLQAAGIFPG